MSSRSSLPLGVSAWLVSLGLFLAPSGTLAKDLPTLLKAGQEALFEGQPERAHELFVQGFEAHGDAPDLHFATGLARWRMDGPKAAVPFFEKAREMALLANRKDLAARASYNLGLALAGQSVDAKGEPQLAGDEASPPDPEGLKKALKAFRQSIALDPSDHDAKYNYLETSRRLEALPKNPDSDSSDPNQENSKDSDSSEKDPKKDSKSQSKDSKDGSEDSKDSESDQDSDSKDPSKENSKDPGDEGKEPEPSDGSDQEEDPKKDQEPSSKDTKPDPSEDSSDPSKPDSSQADSAEDGKDPEDSSGSNSAQAAGPQPGQLDPKAMEQLLRGLEKEEKSRLKRFFQMQSRHGKEARSREILHDW